MNVRPGGVSLICLRGVFVVIEMASGGVDSHIHVDYFGVLVKLKYDGFAAILYLSETILT